VVNGLVYVGSADGRLYALRAKDGSEAWSFATRGAITSAPAFFSGEVFVASYDGNVYALDANRGTLIRTFRTGGPIEASPALASFGGVDWLIIGSTDHTLYAFDANSGRVRWTYVTAGDVYATVAISVQERAVFVGTHNWNIEAHYLDTGVERWLYSCPKGLAVYSSPAVANGVVYFACRNGSVYALDSTKRKFAGGQSPMRLPDWSYQTGGPIYSSAAVADGMLFIGSDDGRIYAFGL
jgi:WD40 repeat protein